MLSVGPRYLFKLSQNVTDGFKNIALRRAQHQNGLAELFLSKHNL